MSNVGKLIRLTREVRNRSLCDLATTIGRSEGHLQHIENGMLSGTPETLSKLATHLDINPTVMRDAYLQDAIDQAAALWNRKRSVKPIVRLNDRK